MGDIEVLIRTVRYVIPRSFRSFFGVCVILLTIVIVVVRISNVMASVMGYVNFNRTFDCAIVYITDSAFSRNADSTAVIVITLMGSSVVAANTVAWASS